MPGWIGRLFGGRTAVEEQRRNPALEATVQRSAEVYDRIPLREFVGEERRAELARELYLEANRICNAKNPIVVCREKYAAAMLALSWYEVLMIRPAPEEDASGLRDQPGITAELHSYLIDLFKNNDHLRQATYGEARMLSRADHWDVLQRHYWERYWLVETLNAARIELGDYVSGRDWDTAFKHAACVNAECAYRRDLELPPAFDAAIARQASEAYSMFTDIVMSGAKDPAAEWRDYYQHSEIPMPNLKNS